MEYLDFDHMLQHAKFTLGLGELPLSCIIHDILSRDFPILVLQLNLSCFDIFINRSVCVHIADYMD